jgi:hypothetical protein
MVHTDSDTVVPWMTPTRVQTDAALTGERE